MWRRGLLYAGSDSEKPAAFDLSGKHLRNYHNGNGIQTLTINDQNTANRPSNGAESLTDAQWR